MAGIIASAVGLCYCQNGSLVRWIRLAVHVSNQFGLIPTKARMLERRFKAGDAPLHGAKAPSIELADKASEDNATEVLRQDFRRELVGIVDGEGLAIGQPADDGDIAGIGKDLQEDPGKFLARLLPEILLKGLAAREDGLGFCFGDDGTESDSSLSLTENSSADIIECEEITIPSGLRLVDSLSCW
eukprot:CAMPEP_0196206448 /NCGR_PEP_ID=MMETSP0912-20130531/7824_1 /TAXON_ID=49265 /ORGANISM="Thalassiosira rotula, Strain GSO102" /LENGTH=185 /DNA_ID=CAMNT_0041480995 /DNA_START=380 /DNA_END=935 /DNA_ORIENTATION=-